jgi:pilus assembly protein CpaB
MRARTLLLLGLALVLAVGTAMLARSWLAQRTRAIEAAPVAAPAPSKSVLVARNDLRRGQILRPEDLVWQVWPEGAVDKNYFVTGGTRTPEALAGWVVKNPIAGGEPVTESKIIPPGDRGFLAAVLSPGMRAISVPVTVTSGISGFIFPGDRVDLLLSYPIPAATNQAQGDGRQQSYEHKAAQTVLRNIRVIGIDQRLENKPGEAVVAHTATFEVTPKQSEIIALASEIGKVSLTLRSLVPGETDGEQAAPAAEAAAEPAADSPIAANATYTIDSDIIPLLPKRVSGKDAPETGIVTILRGSGKESESRAPIHAAKGS